MGPLKVTTMGTATPRTWPGLGEIDLITEPKGTLAAVVSTPVVLPPTAVPARATAENELRNRAHVSVPVVLTESSLTVATVLAE